MSRSGSKNACISTRSLAAGYLGNSVLQEISIDVRVGEVALCIGHNGAGKTTLLKALLGLIPLRSGEIFSMNRPVSRPSPRWWLRHGVAFVPQGQRVFPNLRVEEHLAMARSLAVVSDPPQWADFIDWFPNLHDRMTQSAGTLSGGERQMLALASALLTGARTLLLDEPSLGLAPQLATHTLQAIRSLQKQNAMTVLLAEQNVHEALNIADYVYVLKQGQVFYSGSPSELSDESRLKRVFF